MKATNKSSKIRAIAYTSILIGLLVSGECLAATDVGSMAKEILKSFGALAKLVTAGSFIAGLGFAVGAIMKFKQHKDNPTQIPIGTPIALVFIAAALLFLPTILGIAGATMFKGGGTPGTIKGTTTITG